MNRRSVLQFIGAIRLVTTADTIGIPIFSGLGTNKVFVPDMDHDFRITKFVELTDPENYNLTYEIPRPFDRQRFSIGEPTPLPFWVDNRCCVVEGDKEPQYLQEMFSDFNKPSDILRDMNIYLLKAREGYYRRQAEELHGAEIFNRFSDVLDVVPIHARYWIARYRLAITSARLETQPPHPIDEALRASGWDWLERFGTKTNLPMIVNVLGKSRDGVFTGRQIRDILFCHLIHQIAVGKLATISKYADKPILRKVFPSGLYYRYIERGWPEVMFEYNKIEDFESLMKSFIYQGLQDQKLDRALTLSKILYGGRDAPKQLDGTVFPLMRQAKERFSEYEEQEKKLFGEVEHENRWKITVQEIEKTYNNMINLDRIMNASVRFDKASQESQLGISKRYIKQIVNMMND